MLFDLLKKRMKFLENFASDKYFYGCFPSSKTINVDYELYLQKNKKWVLRLKNSDIPLEKYPGMTSEQVINNLECLGIDAQIVLQLISSRCLEEVCYADLIVDEATKLFGIATIKEVREARERFCDELIKAVKEMTNNKKLIIGGGQTIPKKTGHLTIVK